MSLNLEEGDLILVRQIRVGELRKKPMPKACQLQKVGQSRVVRCQRLRIPTDFVQQASQVGEDLMKPIQILEHMEFPNEIRMVGLVQE